MKSNRILLALALSTVMVLSAACSPAPEPTPTPPEPATEATEAATEAAGAYKDGTYKAEMKDFDPENGWKDTVEITVSGGKITAANWNGVHKDGGDDKKTASKTGKYPMVEKGGAKAPWHEQAEKAEAYLIETQDPAAVNYTDDEGHTDAISGATITVKEFFTLASEALADAK